MSVLDEVMRSLQAGGISRMSSSLGLGEQDVSRVVGGALPALMGALTKNSSNSEGAGALLGALDRDHDGSILDDVAGFLGSAGSADAGTGILRHSFGPRQAQVETALSRSTGVEQASVGKILAMVAPLVMGALGRARRQQGFDASGLASVLGEESQEVRRKAPEAADLLTRLLDSDDDGSVLDDLAEKGAGILGSLFK